MTQTSNLSKSSRSTFFRPLAIVTLVSLSVGLLVTVVSVNAGPAEPTARDRTVAIAVTAFLNKDHLSRRDLDDEISKRFIDTFLETLDPRKLYFLQSDIDHFQQWNESLDDQIKSGDVGFAHDVYKVYLQRIEERTKLINELLDLEHDFTADESISTNYDDVSYPKDEAEARERWRKQIKWDLLIQKAANKADDTEARKRLRRRYRTIAQNKREADSDELLEVYLTALTTSYDPHSTYMSPTAFENFKIMMSLKLEGIGAALQMDDGQTVISKIIPGGAADKEGNLKPKDHIIGVGQGKDGEIVDVVGMRLDAVVKLIRGERGTIVRLEVVPEGKGETKIINITRDRIELTDSEARSVIIEEGEKPNGKPYKIGVIDLPSFYMDMDAANQGVPDYKSTTADVRKLLEEFNKKEVDAVVVDLRENGGGSLPEAVDVTGLFIDEGPIVQIKDAEGAVRQHKDNDRGVAWDGPLVVLISKFSASASEIFAGAIKDYQRGLVIGDHATHGKGTVQTLMDVGQQLYRIQNAPKLGALKITMQQFYRPNGDSTQNRGVLSHIELPWITTHLDVGESDLDYAVAFDNIKPAMFPKMKRTSDTLVSNLKQRSEQRQEQSKEFQKLKQRIAKYLEQKKRKFVSLNEEVFMADRAELNDKDRDDEEDDDNTEVVKRDYYFNEALAITIDYASMLGKGQVAGK